MRKLIFLISLIFSCHLGLTQFAGTISPATRVVLSEEGILNDATLEMNSSTFGTDQTTPIQTLIDNLHDGDTLDIDVAASGTQFRLKGGQFDTIYYYFRDGKGFIQRDNSNLPFTLNANPTSTSPVDGKMAIIGENNNGIINGNGWRGGIERQTKQTTQGWAVGMRFAGVTGIRVQGIVFRNCRSFSSFFTLSQDVSFIDITCEAQGEQNQDGCKFLVGDEFTIINLSGSGMGDDLLSFCSNDIFWPTDPPPTPVGGGQTAYDPWAVYGAISNWSVTGLSNTGSRFMLRLLSGDSPVNSGTVTGVSGDTETVWLIMDNYSEAPENLYGAGGEGSATNLGYFPGTYTFSNINVSLSNAGYKNAYAFINGTSVGTVSFVAYIMPNANMQFYPGLLINTGTNANTINVNLRYVPDPTIGASKIVNNGSVLNLNYTQY
jgi:hypothetical protein